MLTCRDLVGQADAYLAHEMTLWQRAGFRMHLTLCHHCGRYIKNLRLTQTVSTQIPLKEEPSAEQLNTILLMIQQHKE